jgi:hypothetical protein
MDSLQQLAPMCSAIGNLPGTFISGIWYAISQLFSNYWRFIIPTTVIWIIWESLFRYKHSYNSKNGFTPTLNSFVGGGVFFIFESLIQLFFNFLFGKITSCVLLLIEPLYLAPFIATGYFLHKIGFWPYWRLPWDKKRGYRRT